MITLNCYKYDTRGTKTLFWSEVFSDWNDAWQVFDMLTDRIREKGAGWEVEFLRG
jgi:hypothetical protein